jgi:hypothetical protein
MRSYLPSRFAKGLLHGVLVVISLWVVNVFVENKHIFVVSYLLILLLPLLIVGYLYRQNTQQSLILYMITIKEKIFIYPFGVALCLIFFYMFAFVGVDTIRSHGSLYFIGVLILAIFSLTGKLALVLWLGSVVYYICALYKK